jgi:hypothetical protein
MVKNIPLGANKLKKDKDLNKKQIIQALFCIAIVGPWFTKFGEIIF